MSYVDISKIVPSSIRNQFWLDFTDTASDEINLLRDEIIKKKNFFNAREQDDIDQLIEICKSLGFVPDRSIDESIDFLRREIRAIVYRIQNKATIRGFTYPFKAIDRIGKVYNIHWTGSKLIKRPDISFILTELGSHDFTQVFENFNDLILFDTEDQSFITLDIGRTLDESPIWNLDSEILATSHLTVEYLLNKIITLDSIEYLMTETYMSYIDYNSEYNRKTNVIQHDGCHLNIITDSSGYYDNISGGLYTVPDIKLIAAITSQLRDTNNPPLFLDNSGQLDLDQTILAFLDNDANNIFSLPTDQIFCEIVAGTGTKNLISIDFSELDQNLIGLWDFNEQTGDSVRDYSSNLNNLTLIGGYTRGRFLRDKAIFYDGVDASASSTSNITLGFSDISATFWFQGNKSDQLFSDSVIFKLGTFLTATYDNVADNLNIDIFDGVTTYNLTTSITMDGTEYNVWIDIDITNDTARLILNGIEEDNVSILGINNFTGGYFAYVAFDGTTNYFTGYVDELRLYNTVFDIATKQYYYNNLISNVSILNREIYREAIDPEEIYEDDNYYIIHSKVLGNTVKNEILVKSDGIQTSVSGTTDFPNILSNFFSVLYISSDINIKVTADKTGSLIGTALTGTINYSTGAYNIIFYRDYNIIDEIIFSGSITVLSAATANNNIQPNSVTIKYLIGSTSLSAVDDGAGNITGTSITTGTINYSTGQIDITFSSPTDNDDITIDYTYRMESVPDLDTFVTADYAVDQNLNITELGIVDINNSLTVYSTFPQVELGSNLFHLYGHFIIAK